MPELPEVETTTRGIQKEIIGLTIKDVWTDLNSKDKRQNDAVKNPKYFIFFKKEIIGKKVLSAERHAKNILINLSGNKTILIHMKMTGHLMVGEYEYNKKENKWYPINKEKNNPLNDPYNRFVHVVFTLSNKKHLVFCDTRKFGKITLLDTDTARDTKHLKDIGPDPLDKNINWKILKERLSLKPKGKIKTVLMDQSIIAGIGNIYSDEILWKVGIQPESLASKIPDNKIKEIFTAMQNLLKKGINFGGDSMSDYRNIYGLPGKFQLHHEVYRRAGEKCRKSGCSGVIIRKVVNGRSAHFCPIHQLKLI
ncbi:MAG: bifunctional DNA-formamidopyrimidine glycosylase/DNA-(apurinic or apyrimidinic site) lyase [Candidatus Nomurabacteria bacterium]|nr:bifunctional DNA-formamidopyrimidine glycosylase/DNA-(apurinic or apyrimidinic site) lyase [Candidatus Nomurabacteria bacterium]